MHSATFYIVNLRNHPIGLRKKKSKLGRIQSIMLSSWKISLSLEQKFVSTWGKKMVSTLVFWRSKFGDSEILALKFAPSDVFVNFWINNAIWTKEIDVRVSSLFLWLDLDSGEQPYLEAWVGRHFQLCLNSEISWLITVSVLSSLNQLGNKQDN